MGGRKEEEEEEEREQEVEEGEVEEEGEEEEKEEGEEEEGGGGGRGGNVCSCVRESHRGCERGRRKRMRKEIRRLPTSISPPATNTVPASTVLDREKR